MSTTSSDVRTGALTVIAPGMLTTVQDLGRLATPTSVCRRPEPLTGTR